MTFSTLEIWVLIAVIGIGTFVLRFSFLGLTGDRPFPDWALRLLRYTPVAVLPGLVAPLVFAPVGPDGAADPARLVAAAVTIAVGVWSKSALWAIIAGAVVFYGLGAVIGA